MSYMSSESLLLKIETQKSDVSNPYIDKKDIRETRQIESNTKLKEKVNTENISSSLIVVIFLVLLYSIYYSLISKVLKYPYITKGYQSTFLFIIYLIDSYFEKGKNKKNYYVEIIHEENEDEEESKENELKASLLLSNDSNDSNDNKKTYTNTDETIGITMYNRSLSFKKKSKKTIVFILILNGSLNFIIELLVFQMINMHLKSNIGYAFSLLSVEFPLLRLFFFFENSYKFNLLSFTSCLIQILIVIYVSLNDLTMTSQLVLLGIIILKLVNFHIKLLLKSQNQRIILKYSIYTDLSLGLFIILYNFLLSNLFFNMTSLSFLIILLISTVCLYYYMKLNHFSTSFEYCHFSMCFFVVGIFDLLFNDHFIDFICFFMMISMVVLIYVQFKEKKNLC